MLGEASVVVKAKYSACVPIKAVPILCAACIWRIEVDEITRLSVASVLHEIASAEACGSKNVGCGE
jgi:hypothetical protein